MGREDFFIGRCGVFYLSRGVELRGTGGGGVAFV
jgi:hypothetical protein